MPWSWVLILLLVAVGNEDFAERAARAKQALLEKRYDAAAKLYRQLAAERPQEPAARFNLGLALYSLGSYREAARIWDTLTQEAAADPKFWFLRGETDLKLEMPARAIPWLQRAARLEPENRRTQLELAEAYLEAGQFSSGQRAFAELSRAKPEDVSAWEGLTLCELALGPAFREEARGSMEKLQALGDSPARSRSLGRVLLAAGKRAEAVQVLRASYDRNRSSLDTAAELARALWTNREFSEAAGLLSEISQREAANDLRQARWQYEWGDCLLNLGQGGEAQAHFQRAVDVNANLLPAQAKLGEVLLSSGDAAGALRHLVVAESLDQDGSIHFQLATAYRKLGRPAEAANALKKRQELLAAKQISQ